MISLNILVSLKAISIIVSLKAISIIGVAFPWSFHFPYLHCVTRSLAMSEDLLEGVYMGYS